MYFLAPAAIMLVFISSVLAGPIDTANIETVTVPTTIQNVTDPDPPYCTRLRQPTLRFYYTINIPYVPEPHTIEKICGNLWHELKKWPGCVVSPKNGCGPVEGGNRTLEWYFHTAMFCNAGMVRSAYWEATYKGSFGDIKYCQKMPALYEIDGSSGAVMEGP